MGSLERLAAPPTVESARRVMAARSALRAQAEAVSESIHGLIPEVPRASRRRLLRLRRDLYNLRRPRPQGMQELRGTGLHQPVSELLAEMERHEELLCEFRTTYEREVEELRQSLGATLGDADFGAGLRLSSRSLARSLRKHLESSETQMDPKTERGLLRYLTRAAAKATPFGRFCAVVPGHLAKVASPITLSGDPTAKWSRIRLNKRLMQLVLGYLATDEVARRQMPHRLNPTLQLGADGAVFLAAHSGREAFQKVERNAAMDLIVSELKVRGTVTIQELAAAIAALPEVDASREEAEVYLERLVEVGLLQPDLPGLSQDSDWPGRLLQVLAPVDDTPAVQEIRSFLAELARRTETLERDGIGVSQGAIDDLEEFVRDTLERWFDGRSVAPRLVVYEDASAHVRAQIDLDHFGAALSRLEQLFSLLTRIAWIRKDPLTMREFFRERFGEGPVPLLSFYEAYYREHVKPLEQRRIARRSARGGAAGRDSPNTGEEDAEPDVEVDAEAESDEAAEHREPAHPPDVLALRSAQNSLTALVRARWARNPEAREIALTKDDLARAVEDAPALAAESRSLSAFVTWVPSTEPGDPGLVVLPKARGHAGYGKYFSRFLYLLPEQVLQALRDRPPPADAVMAEIAGDAAFNANLRPPIQPCEIIYPTGDRIGCPESVEVVDLDVTLDPSGARLALIERGTDRCVIPLDLGFLNPMARPPLYQLLRHFSPTSETHLDVPWEPDSTVPTAPAVHRPRVTYEGLVVLGREAWIVPPSEIPVPQRNEPEADFFLRVREWHSELGLPEQVYVRAVARSRSGTAPAVEGEQGDSAKPPRNRAKRRGVGDLRKPQYMDFGSPLLIQLLWRYASLGDLCNVAFEECLPAPGALPRDAEGRRWVAESIIEMDLPVEASRETPRGQGQEMAHV